MAGLESKALKWIKGYYKGCKRVNSTKRVESLISIVILTTTYDSLATMLKEHETMY